MILYVCPAGTMGARGPLLKHPCGKAANALDDAGVQYELKKVEGFKNVPLASRGKRDEIKKLSGQERVPILVLDDASVIVGSGAIVAWAKEQS